MLDTLKVDLVHTGLSEKEASVYLALLQLRTANPQQLARAAGVNRSTTYLALQALQTRALVSCIEKEGKICYVAEHPERLTQLVDAASRAVEARRNKMEDLLPHLMALFQSANDVPRVRFFEGEDALHHAREEMLATRQPMWEVYAADESMVQVAGIRERERLDIARRVREGRLLIAIKPGCDIAPFHPDGFEARSIDYARCPFSGSVTIAGHKLCVITRSSKGMGILVDSHEMTSVFRALFESAWASAKSL